MGRSISEQSDRRDHPEEGFEEMAAGLEDPADRGGKPGVARSVPGDSRLTGAEALVIPGRPARAGLGSHEHRPSKFCGRVSGDME
jgi:hypothetical protein